MPRSTVDGKLQAGRQWVTHEQRQRGRGWAVPSKHAHALKSHGNIPPSCPTPHTHHHHHHHHHRHHHPSPSPFATFHFNKTAILIMCAHFNPASVIFFFSFFSRTKFPFSRNNPQNDNKWQPIYLSEGPRVHYNECKPLKYQNNAFPPPPSPKKTISRAWGE